MTDILRPLLIIIFLTISLAAYFLVINTLFTSRVEKAQHIIGQMPWRAFGVGLVNFLFFGVIAIALFAIAENAGGLIRGILTIPALLITVMLAALLSIGLAGMVNIFSEKIFPDINNWKRNIWGSAILCFACALPFMGWFLLFPYLGLMSVGAVILGLFQRNS